MALYIDVSSAVHAKAGIGRYADSLSRALTAAHPGRICLFYNRVHKTVPPPGLEEVPARTVRAGYKPWRMAVWLGHMARLGFNQLVPDAELFHATEHLLPPLRDVPTVLTVHDMIFRLFPEHQKRLNYWYLNATMPLFCRRADAIITVSESSKRDIVRHYGLPEAKISVIHEAAAHGFKPVSPAEMARVRAKYLLPERFLLSVGTIEPRKNLVRLLEALDKLRRTQMRIPLVIVGAKGWLYGGLFQRMEALGMQDLVHLTGYVPDADLPSVYSAATAVAVPSVYEGFGLPVLEAMACGTPVIASRASSLPEVGGDAVLYFDPYDVDMLATAIRAVWSDTEQRRHMQRVGLAQAALFSWERAAEETMNVYRRLASLPP